MPAEAAALSATALPPLLRHLLAPPAAAVAAAVPAVTRLLLRLLLLRLLSAVSCPFTSPRYACQHSEASSRCNLDLAPAGSMYRMAVEAARPLTCRWDV